MLNSILMTSIKNYRLIVILFAVSLLGSCALEDDSCKDTVATVGEPDMTASPVFASPTVAPGGTIDVDIAVDAETVEGTVYLLRVGSQDVGTAVATGLIPSSAGVAEMVTVSLTVDGAANAAIYYPAIVLCDSAVATCTIGAGYTEDITGLLAESGQYVRGTADGGTVDLSSLKQACITISTIDVI